MYEHAAAGSFLSVLIVVGFTLVFHEVERPNPPRDAVPSPAQPVATRGRDRPADPPARATTPPPAFETTSRGVASTLAGRVRDGDRPASVSVSVRAIPVAADPVEPARPIVHSAPPIADRGADPTAARSAITVIGRGERLVDVAVRVYGTAEATVQLWRANRDRLTSVDAPVAEGWLLRTP